MKLIVKNVGTDINPLHLVYTEAGDLIENVSSLKMSEEAMSNHMVCKIAWTIPILEYKNGVSAPRVVDITS